MSKYLFSAAVLTGLCGAAHGVVILANGDSVNLGALLASTSDRQFCVGDKLFTLESFASSQYNLSDFTVTGFIAGGGGLYGVPNMGFDLIGPFGDGSPGDGIVHEMNLQYTVEIKPEFIARGYRITDARLTFNGSAFGDGSFARVDESIFDFFGNTLLGTPSVFAIAGPPASVLFQDELVWGLPGYTKLEVNKDIKTFAAHVNDGATMSLVRQEFSQIPTPGAVSILALAGLLTSRRRR